MEDQQAVRAGRAGEGVVPPDPGPPGRLQGRVLAGEEGVGLVGADADHRDVGRARFVADDLGLPPGRRVLLVGRRRVDHDLRDRRVGAHPGALDLVVPDRRGVPGQGPDQAFPHGRIVLGARTVFAVAAAQVGQVFGEYLGVVYVFRGGEERFQQSIALRVHRGGKKFAQLRMPYEQKCIEIRRRLVGDGRDLFHRPPDELRVRARLPGPRPDLRPRRGLLGRRLRMVPRPGGVLRGAGPRQRGPRVAVPPGSRAHRPYRPYGAARRGRAVALVVGSRPVRGCVRLEPSGGAGPGSLARFGRVRDQSVHGQLRLELLPVGFRTSATHPARKACQGFTPPGQIAGSTGNSGTDPVKLSRM